MYGVGGTHPGDVALAITVETSFFSSTPAPDHNATMW